MRTWDDLNEGVFDEFSLEDIHKNEHDGAGGVIENSQCKPWNSSSPSR